PEQGKLGQNYRKTMLCPQKDNQIPFPSGTSGKIDVFFNSLLNAQSSKRLYERNYRYNSCIFE
ncbi:hypothetical protein, partial [Thiolapillus sp.]